MFILNPPYISELLKDTIRKNGYALAENETTKSLGLNEFLISTQEAVERAKNSKNLKVYINSEDSIEWVIKNLSFSSIPEKINLFKDKVKFRDLLKPLFPEFYYKSVSLEELKQINGADLKYPLILKPAVGFLSFGVYPVKNEEDFNRVISKLDEDISRFAGVFPIEVVDASTFIIEEMIQGEEYAIDAFFDSKGAPVILNIFHHPFFDENDVSDRVYYTSKEIMQKYLNPFEKLLNEIGKLAELKNFPMHLELRIENGKAVPIEINPMRFAGWCDTDLAYFAYGINIYEYYMNDTKPDWDKILASKNDELYYFTGADIPMDIDKKKIKSIDYASYLSDIKEPLDVRKIDYKTKPLFAIVIGKTRGYEEIKQLLKTDLSKFIEM